MAEMIKSLWKSCSKVLPDWLYISLEFKKHIGYFPNLRNPKTFNEKLQWLKLHDRKPIYTTMVDKCEAKKYVASIIGEEYIIPTLGVWNHFDEIDFDALPDQFVLKCTHDSAGIVIVKNKADFDREAAKKKLEACLKQNFYYSGREWPYKNVKPRIIAEKYMEDARTQELRDYKFFCFDGVAKALFIASDRQKEDEETKFDFFDMEFNHLEVKNGHPFADPLPEKPEKFDEMRELAEKLSQKIPHLRVDFYEVNGKAYFGEFTFYQNSGFVPVEPESWDKELGNWIKLPEIDGGGYALIREGYVLWMHQLENSDLTDYKIHCFNGEPRFVLVCRNRFTNMTEDFYDTEWNLMELSRPSHGHGSLQKKPEQLEQMLQLATKLSDQSDFIRVDFYTVNEKIYFGELTLYPASGWNKFEPSKWDSQLGKWLTVG